MLISHLYGKYANKVKAGAEKHYHSSVAVSWLPHERLLLLQQRRATVGCPSVLLLRASATRANARLRPAGITMSLRSLIVLAMAAPAAAYEWYAVFKLEHGSEYKINLGQTGGTTAAPEYADDTMKLYFAEVNEGAAIDAAKLDALVDGAESHMQTYCGTDSAAGNTTTPTVIEMDTEKLCRNFVMAADTQATSHWELHFEEHAHRRRLSGEDVFVAIFAEHDLHAEFESTASGHYLTTAAGVDVEPECDGEVDHSGHDHGRRLAACPKHSESDGASKPAVALALAGLAGGLALFL